MENKPVYLRGVIYLTVPVSLNEKAPASCAAWCNLIQEENHLVQFGVEVAGQLLVRVYVCGVRVMERAGSLQEAELSEFSLLQWNGSSAEGPHFSNHLLSGVSMLNPQDSQLLQDAVSYSLGFLSCFKPYLCLWAKYIFSFYGKFLTKSILWPSTFIQAMTVTNTLNRLKCHAFF